VKTASLGRFMAIGVQLAVVASLLIGSRTALAQANSAVAAEWDADELGRVERFWETLPSNALVILDDGNVVAEWGPIESRVKLSSVRKSLISALYGIYVREGVIDLDSTLKELGIDDEPDPLSELERSATIRMLLQARSGIYHAYVGGTPAMLVGRPERYSHLPGTFWNYNNWDFNALGTIFEQEVDRSIGDVFAERIARPIGMQDFRPEDVYYLSDHQTSHRQYHFRMTARDVAQFGELMRRNGSWMGDTVIPEEWVHDSTQSYSEGDARGGYGYLWWIARSGVLYPGIELPEGTYAAAGAVGKYVAIIPEHGLVIALISQREWPDNASQLSRSELPGPTDSTSRAQMGELVALILEAQP